MNIVFVIKVKIVVLVKWSFRSPTLCSQLSLEWFSYFEHVDPISFKHLIFLYSYLEPHLTKYHSNIGVCLR